jgi:tetratricopeptide (TPR) repeat protein
MFRSGSLESELVTGTNPFLRRPKMEPTDDERRSLNEHVETVLKMAQARLAANPKDVEALYAQGVAYSLRANYNFLARKAYLDALRDATNARKAHDRVVQLAPSNIDARLVQGVHEYIVTDLPFTYRIVGFLTGFHGDRENAVRILKLVAAKGNRNRSDAEVMLAAIYRRERRPAEAIPLLQDMIRRYPRNYLFRFELIQMYSDAKEEEKALRVIYDIEQLKHAGRPGYDHLPIERIYYARGVLQFWYRHYFDACDNLKRVTAGASNVDLNTAVTAWMRLGQTYDMIRERKTAVASYRTAIALAPQSEQAKECRGYLSSPYYRKPE